MKPCEATTHDKVCKLERDNISTRKSWIIIDGRRVSIVNQKSGESATGNVSLTFKEMEKFAKWFLGIE